MKRPLSCSNATPSVSLVISLNLLRTEESVVGFFRMLTSLGRLENLDGFLMVVDLL